MNEITMDTEITVPGARDQVLPPWYRGRLDGAWYWHNSAAGPLLNTYTRPVRGWVVSREYLIRHVANQVQGNREVLEEYLTEVLLHRPQRRPEMANPALPCKTVIQTVLRLARRLGAPYAEHLALVLQDRRRAQAGRIVLSTQ